MVLSLWVTEVVPKLLLDVFKDELYFAKDFIDSLVPCWLDDGAVCAGAIVEVALGESRVDVELLAAVFRAKVACEAGQHVCAGKADTLGEFIGSAVVWLVGMGAAAQLEIADSTHVVLASSVVNTGLLCLYKDSVKTDANQSERSVDRC